MVKVIRFLQNGLNKHKVVWRAVGALSLGILLGALIAIPYDRIFASAPPYVGWLYAAMQSLITSVTFFRARAMDSTALAFEGELDRLADL